LIVEADTRRREEAVMVALQHATVADRAVMRARRRHQQANGTRRVKLVGQLLMLLTILLVRVAFTKSANSSLYSPASRL